MREPSLQITFRHGRPLAAYYYLPHEIDVRVDRSSRRDAGLVVDFAASGQPLGIEITSPGQVTLEIFNALLLELGQPAVGEEEFAPLRAA